MTKKGEKRPPVGAGLLIVRTTDMKILLLRRSEMVTKSGYWAAPGGGVEAGETEKDAAIREGYEELGGLPEDLRIEEEASWYAEGPFFAFATFMATTADRNWTPRINPEHDQWGWFDPRKLPSPIMPGTQKVVKEALF